ncbi:MAG TPA: hypothetical protein VJ994_04245 [Paracoccaceae bacterium]|nr:hypothetical protein [Paracoccaceae bacterium]
MTRLAIFVVAAVASAAAPGAAQTNAADAIEPGTYVRSSDAGCGTLTKGDGLAYVWDRGCDGAVDYEGDDVWSRGSVVYIDAATLSLRSVSPERLEGIWKLRDRSGEVVFERR